MRLVSVALTLLLVGCAAEPPSVISTPAAVAIAPGRTATPETPVAMEIPEAEPEQPEPQPQPQPQPARVKQTLPAIPPLDQHALSAPRSVEGDVAKLAAYLVKPARTEREKARIIYRWITDRIEYDAPSYISGNYADQSPEVTLRARKGVCGGYANLYQALADAAGLKVETISGTAKGLSFRSGEGIEPNHAWNAVRIDGEWELLDSTWGAGSVDSDKFHKEFDENYFCVAPEALISSHFPEDPKWQLLAKPLSAKEFMRTPQIKPEFYAHRMKLIDSGENPLLVDPSRRITISAPQEIQVNAQLYKGGAFVEGNHFLVSRKGDRVNIDVSAPGVGTYELALFQRQRGQAEWSSFASWQLECRSVPGHGADYPRMLDAYHNTEVQLDSPRFNLEAGPKKTRFELMVLGADEVHVQNEGDQLDLIPMGGSFVGEYPLNVGQASVVAHFPEGDRTEALLLYEVK